MDGGTRSGAGVNLIDLRVGIRLNRRRLDLDRFLDCLLCLLERFVDFRFVFAVVGFACKINHACMYR